MIVREKSVPESLVAMACQMYQCRNQARQLLGDEGFRRQVSQFRPLFYAVMSRDRCPILVALIALMSDTQGDEKEGLLLYNLIAVACEMIDPSLPTSMGNECGQR